MMTTYGERREQSVVIGTELPQGVAKKESPHGKDFLTVKSKGKKSKVAHNFRIQIEVEMLSCQFC